MPLLALIGANLVYMAVCAGEDQSGNLRPAERFAHIFFDYPWAVLAICTAAFALTLVAFEADDALLNVSTEMIGVVLSVFALGALTEWRLRQRRQAEWVPVESHIVARLHPLVDSLVHCLKLAFDPLEDEFALFEGEQDDPMWVAYCESLVHVNGPPVEHFRVQGREVIEERLHQARVPCVRVADQIEAQLLPVALAGADVPLISMMIAVIDLCRTFDIAVSAMSQLETGNDPGRDEAIVDDLLEELQRYVSDGVLPLSRWLLPHLEVREGLVSYTAPIGAPSR